MRTENIFGNWHRLEVKFERVLKANSKIQKLAIAGCLAVGGNKEKLPAAIATLCCFLTGIILIDDILDCDPRGEHLKIGVGRASNQALAFQSAGFQNLFSSNYADNQKLQLANMFSKMLFDTAYGQFLDIEKPFSEETYWEMVRAKSSPFYGSIFEMGAIAGGGSLENVSIIREFGNVYGEMIQIHDDLVDCLESTAGPDWTQGRTPLPILFTEIVEHADKDRFIELKKNILFDENLLEAQKILIKCGAVSYCIDQLFPRYKKAKSILKKSNRLNQKELLEVLEEIMVAPRHLIHKIENEQS